MTTFETIYKIVSKIPKGKVMTYGQIADIVGTTPRVVGFAMRANKNPDTVPCHRVIKSDGSLATGYAFGGPNIRKKLLAAEGITFTNDHVNLHKYCYIP